MNNARRSRCVGRVTDQWHMCHCLSVCPRSKRKTTWAISTKLSDTHIFYRMISAWIDPEVKGQGHQVCWRYARGYGCLASWRCGDANGWHTVFVHILRKLDSALIEPLNNKSQVLAELKPVESLERLLYICRGRGAETREWKRTMRLQCMAVKRRRAFYARTAAFRHKT